MSEPILVEPERAILITVGKRFAVWLKHVDRISCRCAGTVLRCERNVDSACLVRNQFPETAQRVERLCGVGCSHFRIAYADVVGLNVGICRLHRRRQSEDVEICKIDSLVAVAKHKTGNRIAQRGMHCNRCLESRIGLQRSCNHSVALNALHADRAGALVHACHFCVAR